jgi:hypothetical protein
MTTSAASEPIPFNHYNGLYQKIERAGLGWGGGGGGRLLLGMHIAQEGEGQQQTGRHGTTVHADP